MRCLHERERVPHLAPQGLDVPAQRPGLCQRRVREAMDLVNADQPGLEARQDGAAAFGSEIERKVRCFGSLRPYDIAPYARTGFWSAKRLFKKQIAPSSAPLEEDYDHLAGQPRAAGRRRRRARRARHGIQGGRADVGRSERAARDSRALRFRASRAMSSRGSRIARWCSRSRAPRPASRFIFPGTTTGNPGELRAFAHARGLFVDSMNSNTFQDHPGQPLSYKFGSLSHTDAAVRRQAIEHNLECLEIGDGARARARIPSGLATAAIFRASCTSGARSIAISTA